MNGRRIFLPAPLLLELFVEEANPPSCFLTDLVEDLEDFLLFAADGETFGSNCKRAESNTCDATMEY